MFKWLLPFLLFVSSALAQTCPTRPANQNDNSCASTAYVANQIAATPVAPGSITLANGDLLIGSVSNVAAAQALSGDCTITNLGVITCTKTGGVAFAASATTDATNAGNISSGTLPAGRLPALTGDVTSSAGSTTTALAWISRVAGKSLTLNNTLTLAGTDSTTMTFPSTNGTVAALNIADQTLAGGANVTSQSLTTGNITVDCGARPLQFITNGGAFTITAPSSDGSCMLLVTNNGTAGATSLSGFSPTTCGGDAVTTTNTSKFFYSIVRINGVSTCMVRAGQ